MEGNNEEDYLDSLLDSVSVIKDDVVEDELYDAENNELLSALSDIMGSSEDTASEAEPVGDDAAPSIETAEITEESASEEEPAMPDLVLDDELKALLGDDIQSADTPQTDGDGLTKEQNDRLSQMDIESLFAQTEGEADNAPAGGEDVFSLDTAIENGGLWQENAEGIEEMTADMEPEAQEEPKEKKGSLFSNLFGKKAKKKDATENGEGPEEENKKKKKEKKAKKDKKAKKEEKAKQQEPEETAAETVDENEHVLNQLFDEQGELIEDKGTPVKKKSFFSKLMDTIKEEDEEEPEPTKEKKEKKSKKSKKAKGDAPGEGEGEDRENPAKGKKAKKAKKPKAPKPKKEKKPKEPPNPAEMMKVSKKVVAVMLVVIVGICGFSYVGINTYHYKNSVSAAMEYLVAGNYEKAFSQIDGLKLRTAEDKALYKQITVIMYVKKNYNSYVNLKKLGMDYDALDSLIHGIARYYEFRETGEELSVLGDMDGVKAKIVQALEQDYGISEALALTYSEIEDPIQYYYIIRSYGGQN